MRKMIKVVSVVAPMLALLPGCAGMNAKREHQHDMLVVLQRLPGHYDNVAQVDAAGAAARTPLDLRIVPVEDTIIGEYLFYVRLAVAGDTRRVLSQQIWSFSQAKDGSATQDVYLFADPGRWRGAANDPQLLQSLTDPDLKPLRGCALSWRKQGSDYEATTGKACRETGGQAAGLLIDDSIALTDAGLTITQLQFGADGRLDAGSEVDHFQRRPQPVSTPDP